MPWPRVHLLPYVWVGGGSRQVQLGLIRCGQPSWRTTCPPPLDAQSLSQLVWLDKGPQEALHGKGDGSPGWWPRPACRHSFLGALARHPHGLSAKSAKMWISWPGPSSPAVWTPSLFVSLVPRPQEAMSSSTEPCPREEGIIWM